MTDHFKQRLLFGNSQAFVKKLEKGKEYKFLQPVYGLGIVADIYETSTADWYHHYQLVKKDNADKSDVIEHLQLIFIELPKFPIKSSNEKKLRLLWLRFLREIDEKTTTVSKDLLEIPEIAQAIELSEESAYTPGELHLYESYWDQVSREKTLIMGKYAEGLIDGEAKGIEKGIEKIAINMLKDNEPLDKICRFTGLSQDNIEKIKDKL